MLIGWQELNWSKGIDKFYFNPSTGAMATGWKFIANK